MSDMVNQSRSYFRDVVSGAIIIVLSIMLALMSISLPLLLVIGLILAYFSIAIYTTYYHKTSLIVLISIVIGGILLAAMSLAINYLKYNPSGVQLI